MDGKSTYHVRERIGEELAKEESLQLDDDDWIDIGQWAEYQKIIDKF